MIICALLLALAVVEARLVRAIMAEQAETLYVMIQQEGLLREHTVDMVVRTITISL